MDRWEMWIYVQTDETTAPVWTTLFYRWIMWLSRCRCLSITTFYRQYNIPLWLLGLKYITVIAHSCRKRINFPISPLFFFFPSPQKYYECRRYCIIPSENKGFIFFSIKFYLTRRWIIFFSVSESTTKNKFRFSSFIFLLWKFLFFIFMLLTETIIYISDMF